MIRSLITCNPSARPLRSATRIVAATSCSRPAAARLNLPRSACSAAAFHTRRSPAAAATTMSAAYTPPAIALGGPSAAAAAETAGYGLSHTMIRVKDAEASLAFYREVLGMTLVHTMHSEGGRFTNYFLLYPQSPVPEEAEAKRTWMWSQQGIVELCHNWGTESQADFKHCSGNEAEHKGFGHLCLFVDSLQKSVDRFTSLGVEFKKRPEEGSMRHIAFILDPDGYWIEVIAKGGAKM